MRAGSISHNSLWFPRMGAEACILQVPSEEAVVARSFCKCVRLRGADLDAVLDLFPEYLAGPATHAKGVLYA